MKLGINLDWIRKPYCGEKVCTFEQAAELCAETGLLEIDYLNDVTQDDWEKDACTKRKLLDSSGLAVHQTHAPFFRYDSRGEGKSSLTTERAVRASAILGAKYTVIHADEFRVQDRYDVREIMAWEKRDLAPALKAAEETGIVIAVENLFDDHCGNCVNGRSRFTGLAEEVLAFLRYMDHPLLRCCWDFGHAQCAHGKTMLEEMRSLAPYIVCTHVHDNYYERDLHLPPGFGTIDWKAHLRLLKEFRYSGNFTFEFVYGNIPFVLRKEYLLFAKRMAETMMKEAGV